MRNFNIFIFIFCLHFSNVLVADSSLKSSSKKASKPIPDMRRVKKILQHCTKGVAKLQSSIHIQYDQGSPWIIRQVGTDSFLKYTPGEDINLYTKQGVEDKRLQSNVSRLVYFITGQLGGDYPENGDVLVTELHKTYLCAKAREFREEACKHEFPDISKKRCQSLYHSKCNIKGALSEYRSCIAKKITEDYKKANKFSKNKEELLFKYLDQFGDLFHGIEIASPLDFFSSSPLHRQLAATVVTEASITEALADFANVLDAESDEVLKQCLLLFNQNIFKSGDMSSFKSTCPSFFKGQRGTIVEKIKKSARGQQNLTLDQILPKAFQSPSVGCNSLLHDSMRVKPPYDVKFEYDEVIKDLWDISGTESAPDKSLAWAKRHINDFNDAVACCKAPKCASKFRPPHFSKGVEKTRRIR